MNQRIEIPEGVGGLAEDKDLAKAMRIQRVLPALDAGDTLVLDFSQVHRVTQSFVHALIGEALQKHGAQSLEQIEFFACEEQVRRVVDLVVNYSLGGFQPDTEV